MNFFENLLNVWNTQEIQEVSGFGNVGQNTGLMSQCFQPEEKEETKYTLAFHAEGKKSETQ